MFIKKLFNKILLFLEQKWVEMRVDKMLIDPSSGRYHVLLKSKDPKKKDMFLHSGFLLQDEIIQTLFLKNNMVKNFLKQLGVKFKYVKILKKIGSFDSAVCVFKQGFLYKKIYLSSVEALKIAQEYDVTIKVSRRILGVNYFDMSKTNENNKKIEDNIFFLRTHDKRHYDKNEVIM